MPPQEMFWGSTGESNAVDSLNNAERRRNLAQDVTTEGVFEKGDVTPRGSHLMHHEYH